MKTYINPARDTWQQILQRPAFDHKQLEATVQAILDNVKQNGDSAVQKYSQQFDGVILNEFSVSAAEIKEATLAVDADLKAAIELAKLNITAFHNSQKEEVKEIKTITGVMCWRRAVAIEKVGLYIPGGTAPLFSTLLMLGIPAVLAGCKEIVVCTPPDKKGKINPIILYVAQLIGLKKIYKIGGVQAIAAMAYGTETVSQVNKIFGPGNQYVTCAKQLINAAGIAIDIPAGPSELAVYADETCDPAFVAADLLSQAEHGIDSQVLLVASSVSIIEKVKGEIEKQLNQLPRKEIAGQSLQNSLAIVMEKTETAFDLLNAYAPEHLIIATDDAALIAEKVINAGSVFLGHYSPESAGDYASGTNHTLPTNGYAKAYSGVSLDSFIKKITFQKITKAGIKNIGQAVETMAAAEGLDAHKNAVTIRLHAIKNSNEI
ncbi:MAG: histidinol dehydrogenase [Ferruginibacter sp.]